MILIDRDIARPPRAKKPSRYPWKEMVVGDSFFAPGVASNGAGLKKFAVVNGEKVVPGSKWSVRTATENGVKGLRCWRVS